MRVHLNAAWNWIRVWVKQATGTKAQALRERRCLFGGLWGSAPTVTTAAQEQSSGSEESRTNEPPAGKLSPSSSLDKDVGICSDSLTAWCQLPFSLSQMQNNHGLSYNTTKPLHWKKEEPVGKSWFHLRRLQGLSWQTLQGGSHKWLD